MDPNSVLSSLELVAILSLLDCTYVEPDARDGIHKLLEGYLNAQRAVKPLTGGVPVSVLTLTDGRDED